MYGLLQKGIWDLVSVWVVMIGVMQGSRKNGFELSWLLMVMAYSSNYS